MPRKKKDAEVPSEPPTIVNMSLRLDSALHQRLRKLAFDREEHMHSLAIRGIEQILKAEGY